MTALSIAQNALARTAEKAHDYAEQSKAANTRRAYAAAMRDFESWCGAHGFTALPATPAAVALYFSDAADRVKVSTIRLRAVAIAQAHKNAGLESPVAHPVVRDVLRGIANAKGTAPERKDALTLDGVKDALLAIKGTDLQVLRDRAIVLLGFWGGFRRSEIAALDAGDVRFTKQGVVVSLRRSKTDQTGEGREVGLPALAVHALCPVRAVRAWLDASAIVTGALFRTLALDRSLQDVRIDGRDVARLIQRLVKRAGLDGNFAAHSLRAGFVTSAAQAGVSEADIQRVTGHRSIAILRGYVRRANLFDAAPQAKMVAAVNVARNAS